MLDSSGRDQVSTNQAVMFQARVLPCSVFVMLGILGPWSWPLEIHSLRKFIANRKLALSTKAKTNGGLSTSIIHWPLEPHSLIELIGIL